MQRWLEALLFILSAAWLIFPACTSGLLPSSQAETESSHANNAFQPSSLLSIGMALTLVLHVMFEGANWQGFICYAVCSVAVTDSVLSIFGLLGAYSQEYTPCSSFLLLGASTTLTNFIFFETFTSRGGALRCQRWTPSLRNPVAGSICCTLDFTTRS
jgi:hypothetical protein